MRRNHVYLKSTTTLVKIPSMSPVSIKNFAWATLIYEQVPCVRVCYRLCHVIAPPVTPFEVEKRVCDLPQTGVAQLFMNPLHTLVHFYSLCLSRTRIKPQLVVRMFVISHKGHVRTEIKTVRIYLVLVVHETFLCFYDELWRFKFMTGWWFMILRGLKYYKSFVYSFMISTPLDLQGKRQDVAYSPIHCFNRALK